MVKIATDKNALLQSITSITSINTSGHFWLTPPLVLVATSTTKPWLLNNGVAWCMSGLPRKNSSNLQWRKLEEHYGRPLHFQGFAPKIDKPMQVWAPNNWNHTHLQPKPGSSCSFHAQVKWCKVPKNRSIPQHQMEQKTSRLSTPFLPWNNLMSTPDWQSPGLFHCMLYMISVLGKTHDYNIYIYTTMDSID